MMNKRIRYRLVVLMVISAATGAAVWALVHFNASKRHRLSPSANYLSESASISGADLWARGVEKVRADRGEPAGGSAAVEVPPELRHYKIGRAHV